MAGGKETPRQKLISLMYLVLMALLALNVSKEVLNAFIKVDQSLKDTKLAALNRNESCGGHFREEYQTPEAEAMRDDKNFAYVAAWEYTETDKDPVLHKEQLIYENIKIAERNYK